MSDIAAHIAEVRAALEDTTPVPWEEVIETERGEYGTVYGRYLVGLRHHFGDGRGYEWVFRIDDDYGHNTAPDLRFAAKARECLPQTINLLEAEHERAERLAVIVREAERYCKAARDIDLYADGKDSQWWRNVVRGLEQRLRGLPA